MQATEPFTLRPTAGPEIPSSVLTILLASASPDVEVRLRVDTEFRQIIEKLKRSRYRERLQVIQIQALRFDDLRAALLEHEPHVLHLSCHGLEDGSLTFESASANGSQIIPKNNLLKLLRALADKIYLVVFNACHSSVIARDVPPTIPLSIGMSDDVQDDQAIFFSAALYEALAYGRSVENAFDTAVAGLSEDDALPELFPAAESRARLRPAGAVRHPRGRRRRRGPPSR